jgi:hypothetical protein
VIAGEFIRLLSCGIRTAYSAVRAVIGTATRDRSLPDQVRPSSADRG